MTVRSIIIELIFRDFSRELIFGYFKREIQMSQNKNLRFSDAKLPSARQNGRQAEHASVTDRNLVNLFLELTV